MLKALSVDLWETLIEAEPGPIETYTYMKLKALWEVLNRYGNVDFNNVIEVYKKIIRYKDHTPSHLFAKMIALILGFNNEKVLEEASIAYEHGAYSYKPRIIPGARELLEYAKNSKLRVVVVTNTSFSATGVLKLLENAGLGDYVDYVASSSDLGVEKPNPRIFQIALRAINVEPYEAIHIGDSCSRDVLGSLLAGLKPVLYARKHSSVELCKALNIPIVDSLKKTIGVLEAILKS